MLSAKPLYVLKPVVGGHSMTHLDAKRAYAGRQTGPYLIAVLNTAGTQPMWCGALPAMQH